MALRWSFITTGNGKSISNIFNDCFYYKFNENGSEICIIRDPDANVWLYNMSHEKVYLNGEVIMVDDFKELNSGDKLLFESGEDLQFFIESDVKDKAERAEDTGCSPAKRLSLQKHSSCLDEYLSCPICSRILLECQSVQPCLHSFCKHCLLSWRVRSDECPTCRGKIRDYAKNCQLDAIVQEYLKSHPDYDLTSEEKSAIKEQIVEYEAQLHSQSAQPEAGHLMANGAVDEEEEEEEDEPTTCPWCPLTTSATGLPCSQHRTCFECGLLMPAPGVAEQLNLRDPGCALCKRDVCCLLANDDTPCRCDQHTCASSLNESRNHLPFHAKLINDVETAHLLTYKANKRLSEVDFVDAVLSRFASLTLHDFNDGLDVVALGSITPDTRLCRQCRDLCFSRLLYGWKMSLPPGDQRLWPSRPNCYYGYNCHTQHRSLQHAAKYNHCCPQTRFH